MKRPPFDRGRFFGMLLKGRRVKMFHGSCHRREMHNDKARLLPNSVNGHVDAGSSASAGQLAPEALDILGCCLKDQWKRYRKQLRKCRRKVSKNAVHDLRVEARRLLSLLDLLGPFVPGSCVTKPRGALKCYLDTFDNLRDTHVQLSATCDLAKEFKAAQQFRRFLKKRESELRKSTRKETKHLRVKPLGKLIKAFREFIKRWQRRSRPRQANLLLVRDITRAFDRTRQLKNRINPEDTHSIHCTRIAFKKFRYIVEALSTQPGFQGREMLERFRRYQSLMGDIQDAEVLLRAFEKFVRKQKTKVEPALELTEALFHRRRQLVRKYIAHAHELLQFWPPSVWDTGSINSRRILKYGQTRPAVRSSSALEA